MEHNPQPKVIIAMAVADSASLKALTAHAVGCTIIENKDIIKDYIIRIGCDIVSNRTWLVKEAIKNGGTHILFVDCDMHFTSDSLARLLAHGKEIVGVEYNKRHFPLEGVYEPLDEKTDTLYKAKHVGTGLLLIDLNVFKSTLRPLASPWFNFGRNSEGALMLGEDVWFCNTARDAGYDG